MTIMREYESLVESATTKENLTPLRQALYEGKKEPEAKDLTGYTITVRMSKSTGPGRLSDLFNKTGSAVVAANGTWSYALAAGETPPRGVYYVTVELTKSGDKESTLNRVELHILEGPSA